MDCSMPGLAVQNSWSLLKVMVTKLWCHQTIPSSAVLFSFSLQSFPASGSFLRSQFFTSGGQSIGASASVLPMNIQDWFPLGFTGLISMQYKGLSRVFSNTIASIFQHSTFFMVQISHPYMTTRGKKKSFTRQTFVGKVMSLLFKILSRLVITFFSKEKSSFNFMAVVTICSDFGAQEKKVYHCFLCFPIYLPWSDGTGCHDLSFWMLSFKPTLPLSSFTFIKRLFSSSSLFSISTVSSAYLKLLIFFPASWFQLVLHPGISHSLLYI